MSTLVWVSFLTTQGRGERKQNMALAEPTPESWGEALKRHVGRRLDPIVDGAQAVYGPIIGSRNTFAKLFEQESEPDRMELRIRALVLLVAIGQDPALWKVTDDDFPAMYKLTKVRYALRGLAAQTSRRILLLAS